MRKLIGTGKISARPSLAVLVDRQIDALDQLASELRGGIRGPAHFDLLEERAQAIGAALVAAFRTR